MEESKPKLKLLLVMVILFFIISLFSTVLIYENFISKLERESESFLTEVEGRNAKIETLISNYTQYSQIMDNRMEELKAQHGEVNSAIKDYTSVSDSELSTLENEIASKKSQVSSLKSQVKTLEAQLN